MSDYFNNFDKHNMNTAFDVMRVAEAKEKEQRQKELERQKKELYDNKVLEVAEETKHIEEQAKNIAKESLAVSKKNTKISIATLIIASIGSICAIITLIKQFFN